MQVLVDLSEANRNCVLQNVSERKILSSEHPVFACGLVKYKQRSALRRAVCTTIYVTQERLCSLTEYIFQVHATLRAPHLTRLPSSVLDSGYTLQAERLKTLYPPCPVTDAAPSLASQCGYPAKLFYLRCVTSTL